MGRPQSPPQKNLEQAAQKPHWLPALHRLREEPLQSTVFPGCLQSQKDVLFFQNTRAGGPLLSPLPEAHESSGSLKPSSHTAQEIKSFISKEPQSIFFPTS